MSHENRMKIIGEEGSGGFSLQREEMIDAAAAEKSQKAVDVSEIVAKYDKESAYRTFNGWLETLVKIERGTQHIQATQLRAIRDEN